MADRQQFGANLWLVDEMYQKYLRQPDSVSDTWRVVRCTRRTSRSCSSLLIYALATAGEMPSSGLAWLMFDQYGLKLPTYLQRMVLRYLLVVKHKH